MYQLLILFLLFIYYIIVIIIQFQLQRPSCIERDSKMSSTLTPSRIRAKREIFCPSFIKYGRPLHFTNFYLMLLEFFTLHYKYIDYIHLLPCWGYKVLYWSGFVLFQTVYGVTQEMMLSSILDYLFIWKDSTIELQKK